MPGRLGEPPSPPFYSPVSTHGAQAPQGGPAHSAAGTIGTLSSSMDRGGRRRTGEVGARGRKRLAVAAEDRGVDCRGEVLLRVCQNVRRVVRLSLIHI